MGQRSLWCCMQESGPRSSLQTQLVVWRGRSSACSKREVMNLCVPCLPACLHWCLCACNCAYLHACSLNYVSAEVFYLPDAWWHATLNRGLTIGYGTKPTWFNKNFTSTRSAGHNVGVAGVLRHNPGDTLAAFHRDQQSSNIVRFIYRPNLAGLTSVLDVLHARAEAEMRRDAARRQRLGEDDSSIRGPAAVVAAVCHCIAAVGLEVRPFQEPLALREKLAESWVRFWHTCLLTRVACMPTRMSPQPCLQTYLYMSACLHTYVHTHDHTHMSTHITRVYTCMHVCLCTCVHTFTHAYAHDPWSGGRRATTLPAPCASRSLVLQAALLEGDGTARKTPSVWTDRDTFRTPGNFLNPGCVIKSHL